MRYLESSMFLGQSNLVFGYFSTQRTSLGLSSIASWWRESACTIWGKAFQRPCWDCWWSLGRLLLKRSVTLLDHLTGKVEREHVLKVSMNHGHKYYYNPHSHILIDFTSNYRLWFIWVLRVAPRNKGWLDTFWERSGGGGERIIFYGDSVWKVESNKIKL